MDLLAIIVRNYKLIQLNFMKIAVKRRILSAKKPTNSPKKQITLTDTILAFGKQPQKMLARNSSMNRKPLNTHRIDF